MRQNCNNQKMQYQSGMHHHMPNQNDCNSKNDMPLVVDLADAPIGMSYTPMQKWGNLNEPAEGLAQGSIFKSLVLPFYCTNCPMGRRGM